MSSAPLPTTATHAVGFVSAAPLSADRTRATDLMTPAEFVPNGHVSPTFIAVILSALGSFWRDSELTARLVVVFRSGITESVPFRSETAPVDPGCARHVMSLCARFALAKNRLVEQP